jgi:hypothetical protein
LFCIASFSQALHAETVRSANFEVIADSGDVANLLAGHAEELRTTLAQDWLGSELPTWEQRCAVQIDAGSDRLSGDTTYSLAPARDKHWRMVLRGPVDRIVETLLPHEVLHTILASHYRQAVPRWADEGAALSVEAKADQDRLWAHEGTQLLRGPRRPLVELFASEQYPDDRNELRAFYAQGAAVTEFLLLAGKARFLSFVELGMKEGWERAVAVHYGFSDVASLEAAWIDWLHNARPTISLAQGQLLADAVGFTPVVPTRSTGLAADAFPVDNPSGLRTVGSGPRANP